MGSSGVSLPRRLNEQTGLVYPAMWPFDEPANVAVITMRRILMDGGPILYVSRSEEDGSWFFGDGGAFEVESAMVVALSSIVKRDPSVGRLADLPDGWRAWRRTVLDEWVREPNPEHPAEPGE